jgi:hypothetical protein
MNPLENSLRNYMIERGISPDVADRAAKRCAGAIERNAVLFGLLGGAVCALAQDPGALLCAVAAGSVAGVGTLLISPSCQEVREAAFKLSESFPQARR